MCNKLIYMAVIGRTEEIALSLHAVTFPFQNYPLFIQTIPTDNELKFYYTVHTSLDVVEEKISSVGKNINDLRELYLGLLYPTEDYKVYPYLHQSVAHKLYQLMHKEIAVDPKYSNVILRSIL